MSQSDAFANGIGHAPCYRAARDQACIDLQVPQQPVQRSKTERALSFLHEHVIVLFRPELCHCLSTPCSFSAACDSGRQRFIPVNGLWTCAVGEVWAMCQVDIYNRPSSFPHELS